MTIIEQLAKLAEIAPDDCRFYPSDNSFVIGQYRFWWQGEQFWGQTAGKGFGGQPALAWLRDALEQTIEARGWYWEVHYGPRGKSFLAEVHNIPNQGDTGTEALLGALIKAVTE